jgi:hypothetical protein
MKGEAVVRVLHNPISEKRCQEKKVVHVFL